MYTLLQFNTSLSFLFHLHSEPNAKAIVSAGTFSTLQLFLEGKIKAMDRLDNILFVFLSVRL